MKKSPPTESECLRLDHSLAPAGQRELVQGVICHALGPSAHYLAPRALMDPIKIEVQSHTPPTNLMINSTADSGAAKNNHAGKNKKSGPLVSFFWTALGLQLYRTITDRSFLKNVVFTRWERFGVLCFFREIACVGE